jgi:hypothetical protein
MPTTHAKPKAKRRQKSLPQLSVIYSELNSAGSAIVERDGMTVIAHSFEMPGFTAHQVGCLLAGSTNLAAHIAQQLPKTIDRERKSILVSISGEQAYLLRQYVRGGGL